MSGELPPQWVRESLKRLAAAHVEIFGSSAHRFHLHPPLPEAELRAFEERHHVLLPPDYAAFVTEVGNGGAGPAYGLFPLGMWDGTGRGLVPWVEDDGLWGRLSRPFPHAHASALVQAEPDEHLADSDPAEYERQWRAYEGAGSTPTLTNGTMPICELGCAHRVLLVVTGTEAGHVWEDYRASDGGMCPIVRPDGTHATFGWWYRQWLDDTLGELPTASQPSRGWFERIKRAFDRG